MAELVSAVIDRAQRAFPRMSDADGLEYYIRALREGCQDFPLYRNEVVVTLTASDDDYDLADTIVQITAIFYETSASVRHEMNPASIEGEEWERPHWRYESPSTPIRILIRQKSAATDVGGLEMVLSPPPDTTSVAGYPRVLLHVTEYPGTDPIAGDSTPEILERPDWFQWKMCAFAAWEAQLFEVAVAFDAKADKEKARQWAHIAQKLSKMPPRFEPRSARRRLVAV